MDAITDIKTLRDRATVLYEAGDLHGAERICREILGKVANCATTCHLLGAICLRQQNAQEAVAWFDKAIAIRPDYPEALSNRGAALRRLNRLAEALSCYERALAIRPGDVVAINNRGAVLLDIREFQAALESFDQAVALQPAYTSALNNRGNALRQLHRLDEAVASFDKALALDSNSIEARYNRGLALADLGHFSEAVMDFDHMLTAHPSDAMVLFHRGRALHRAGRPWAALKSYDRALAVAPDFVPALNDRGTVLLTLGRFEDALADFDRVLAVAPRHPGALSNRGAALQGLGRLELALAALGEAHLNDPDNPTVSYNRGTILQSLERFDEALESYDKTLARDPDNASCWNNRGGTLRSLGQLADALASYDRAVAVSANYVDAWLNRGGLLRELKRPDEALQSYDRALATNPDRADILSSRANLLWVNYRDHVGALRDLERAVMLDPHHPYLKGDILHLRMYGGWWQDFDKQVAALDECVRAGEKVATPFVYQVVSQSPKDLQACSILYANDRYPERACAVAKTPPHSKIRVGYLSGELREQATSFLAVGLYECHDRTQFEILAFDTGYDDSSAMRKRLRVAFDDFVDISALSDQKAAERVRAKNIDILVNLNGYFGEARMGVFAFRPAPVQVNFLGFPGTLGADYIDYLIADRILIPEAERGFYNEHVVYLPDCYQVNDCKRAIGENIPSRKDCGLPDQGLVFCNFNQSYKLIPLMFDVWMRILQQVEGSVLWLLESNRDFPRNMRAEAERRGVAAERLVFAPLVAVDDHLARHRLADLFLDTIPCNAHTGASDALWAGLPMVTCRGSTFAGRVAASLLHAIGLPELVTDDLAAYESLCVKLAHDPPLLEIFRARLWENRRKAPLFDTDRYRRNIEAAYRIMWENHLQGRCPQGFSV